ncbi:hypothetical protein LguiB_020688 [Lonicera macranthoides]
MVEIEEVSEVEAAAIAASSSSSSAEDHHIHRCKYDVFLSFRGEDTRKTFIDHLYSALVRSGIYTFKDDERLKTGESISPALLKAIEESSFAVVVFSKNYASSRWCLDELVKIMECSNKSPKGQTVIPIFYDVKPSDGTENIEGILLHPHERECTIEMGTKAFRKMTKLRLLEIHNTCIPKGPDYLPDELRWIDWDKYPSNSLPAMFEANVLVGLRLRCSRLKQLWEGRMDFLCTTLAFLAIWPSRFTRVGWITACGSTLRVENASELVSKLLDVQPTIIVGSTRGEGNAFLSPPFDWMGSDG